MAISTSYPKGVPIEDSDLFVGTKGNTNRTVNYTAQGVADYLNINAKVSIGGQMSFKFSTVPNIPKTIAFDGGLGDGNAFSAINKLIVSAIDLSSANITIFLNYLNNSQILLSQQNQPNFFGHYKITGYTQIGLTDFYELDLEYIGGNGTIGEDQYYDLVSFVLTSGSTTTPTLEQVLISGNESATKDAIFRLDSDKYLKINRADQSIEFWDKIMDGINPVSYLNSVLLNITNIDGDDGYYTQVQGGGVNLTYFNTMTNENTQGGISAGGVAFYDVLRTKQVDLGLQYGLRLKTSEGINGLVTINSDDSTVNYTLKTPNKAAGIYTIATLDDIPSYTVPTLEEVLTEGNESTTQDAIFRLDADKYIKINRADQTIELWDNIGSPLSPPTVISLEGFTIYDTVYMGSVINVGGIEYSLPTGASSQIATLLDIPNTNNFVPYTGANANVNLGEFELKAGQVTLDTTPTISAAVATTRWNDTIGSSETTLKGGSVILKNGVDLVARVVNKVTPNTTLTKANYQVVKVSGAQGQRLAVNLAQANNDNNSADTLGIVTETIATNQEGFIITVGQLEGINTTGSLQGETWADGDVLYLSPTTAGRVTNIKPTGATGHIVILGYVEYAHSVNGKIYVKIMNGWELDELHNVAISSVSDKQLLSYDSATQLWKNKSVTTADITDSTNKRYVTDAQATVISNTSGTNTGDNAVNSLYSGLASSKQDTLTETNFGSFMNARTTKNTLVDADEVVSDDSADSNKAKKTTWLNVWTNYIKVKADAVYTTTSAVASQITTALSGYATQAYADAKVQNSLSASTTIAPSATAVNTALDLRKKVIVRDVTTASVTGTTSLTLAKTYELTAGTLSASGFLDVYMFSSRAGSSLSHSMGLYINTTNNFATATLIATITTGGNFAPHLPGKLQYILKDNLIIGGLFNQTSGSNMPSSATRVSVACNNTSASVWLFVGVTPASTQTITLEGVEILN